MSVFQCSSNSDCSDEQECKLGFCVPKVCITDNQCGKNQVCLSGICVTVPAEIKLNEGDFSETSLLKCKYPGDVFSTCFMTHDASTSRYISLAVFAIFIVVIIVLAGLFVWKDMIAKEPRTAVGSIIAGLFIAISTWFSLQLTVFNTGKDYLYAVTAFVTLITILLAIVISFREKKSPVMTRGSAALALFMEFIVLILLIASPNFAGANGKISQAALITPLIAATVAATAMA